MNMVAYTTNTNDFTAGSIDQLPYITVYTLQMVIGYLWAGSLNVKDDVQIYFV